MSVAWMVLLERRLGDTYMEYTEEMYTRIEIVCASYGKVLE